MGGGGSLSCYSNLTESKRKQSLLELYADQNMENRATKISLQGFSHFCISESALSLSSRLASSAQSSQAQSSSSILRLQMICLLQYPSSKTTSLRGYLSSPNHLTFGDALEVIDRWPANGVATFGSDVHLQSNLKWLRAKKGGDILPRKLYKQIRQ